METFNLNKDTLTFDTITDPQADAVYGRLKMLQDLRDHIEVLQESYTRLLVVNEKDSDGSPTRSSPATTSCSWTLPV